MQNPRQMPNVGTDGQTSIESGKSVKLEGKFLDSRRLP